MVLHKKVKNIREIYEVCAGHVCRQQGNGDVGMTEGRFSDNIVISSETSGRESGEVEVSGGKMNENQ